MLVLILGVLVIFCAMLKEFGHDNRRFACIACIMCNIAMHLCASCTLPVNLSYIFIHLSLYWLICIDMIT
jgi:hypothetical protein